MWQPLLGAYTAAMDTNMVNLATTDLPGYFSTIKALVLSVVVFGLVLGYAKLLRRK